MEPKTDRRQVEASLVQKAAPTIVSALVVAAIGSGIITWHISDSNTLRIQKLEDFAKQGERCTFRDCQRLERLLYILQQDLDSHENEEAHREAAERFRVLREKMEEVERAIKNDP